MKKLLGFHLSACVASTVLVMCAVSVLVASASDTPPTAIGRYALDLTRTEVVSSDFVDGYVVVVRTATYTLEGGLNGDVVAEETILINSTLDYTLEGEGTFTGALEGGESGALAAAVTGSGNLRDNTFEGTYDFAGGTRGLAGVQAQGTFAETPFHGTYSTQLVSVP